jgi:hypothetical protein
VVGVFGGAVMTTKTPSPDSAYQADVADTKPPTPAPPFPPSNIDAVFGSLDNKGAPLSIEDMDAAVAAEAKRRTQLIPM